ncbi:hypothetical protein BLA60_01550 [Actinophytocola xinjiangensis]|uniref:Acyl-CoA thioesterase n=1 Tax=Actinophytocola xinjiangensis TaxID=485602 RepID=A0A7Z1B1G9_9PSEU|nr:thioesterase family protein [Actinophytocola xinjiangensis]OLF13897.1 hypothetical protein BLA60_01550 [Actinophytocola xinjiangensis]
MTSWGRWRREADGFVVPAEPELCSALGTLFGGWGMGVLAEVAHRVSGRPVRDLAVSFVRPVPRGTDLLVRAETVAAGRSLAHVRLEAGVPDGPAMVATAVTGPDPRGVGSSRPVPDTPPPHECPEREYAHGPGTGTSVLLDVRVVAERLDRGVGGAVTLWARLRREVPDEVRLAVVSDHLPYLLRRCVPGLSAISTVSASLRVVDRPREEWVLLVIDVDAVADRFAVGRTTLWSAGRLVATAEQTSRLHRGR